MIGWVVALMARAAAGGGQQNGLQKDRVMSKGEEAGVFTIALQHLVRNLESKRKALLGGVEGVCSSPQTMEFYLSLIERLLWWHTM